MCAASRTVQSYQEALAIIEENLAGSLDLGGNEYPGLKQRRLTRDDLFGILRIMADLAPTSTLVELDLRCTASTHRPSALLMITMMEDQVADALLSTKNRKKQTGNNLRNQGAGLVAEVLRVHPTLEKLNLRNNVIGNEGGVSLATALAVNSTLQVLNLENNVLDDEVACRLAAALKDNKGLKLKRLWLAENRIGTQGAVELARALRVSSSLEGLFLSGNQLIEEPAGSEFVLALDYNTTLQLLYLAGK